MPVAMADVYRIDVYRCPGNCNIPRIRERLIEDYLKKIEKQRNIFAPDADIEGVPSNKEMV